jgi:hypothetical protein
MEKSKLVIVLTFKLLEVIEQSGANEQEGICALRAAEALLPESDLSVKPITTLDLS